MKVRGELVEEAFVLIEKIIEEHKQIIGSVRALEQVTNDASALRVLDKAKEDFVPGRLDNQKRGLQSWQESLETIDQGIQAHFDREETGLLAAFEKHGGKMLVSALRVLLTEHEGLRDRLVKLKKDVAELAAGGSSREVWEGRAWGIRVYVSHTRKLFEAHAQSEQELLHKIRAELSRV